MLLSQAASVECGGRGVSPEMQHLEDMVFFAVHDFKDLQRLFLFVVS